MKETMKEVVIIGPKQFEVREVPVPKPADNEVLIQMKAAGVCGSDVHQFLGENPNAVFPRVPGHENAGVIVEVGKDVKNVKWWTWWWPAASAPSAGPAAATYAAR